MSSFSLFPGFSPTSYSEEDFKRDVETFGFLAIRRLTERVYQEAPTEVRRIFSELPEIRRMIGQLRHSLMEQELRTLGRRGDISQLGTTDEQLRSRRGCIKPGSYVAMHYGNILITQSHTDAAEQLPPEALFRKNNARLNQWTLEECIEENGPKRYIVVTHGPTKENPEELGFIQAGFLHPNGHKYVYQYDLLKLPISQIMGVTDSADNVEIEIDIIEEAKEAGEEE